MRRLLIIASLLCAPYAARGEAVLRSVEVEGTEFKVTLSDGRVLRSSELVGATLTIANDGPPMRVRIEAVERDPDAVSGPVWLHTLSTQQPNGAWINPCVEGPDGRRQGFPLAGKPRADGTMDPADTFELTCTSGGRGKCVRLGYLPWQDGTARDLFNACVRLLRADYCGDGRSTTRNGTTVDLYDDGGIQKAEGGAGLAFEAGWSASGAVCVHHVRILDNITPAQLVAQCPRLKGRVGEMCTEEKARSLGARLFNQSKP